MLSHVSKTGRQIFVIVIYQKEASQQVFWYDRECSI